MIRKRLKLLVLVFLAGTFWSQHGTAQVSIGISGDSADVKTKSQSGIMMVGGGKDVDEVYQWMIKRSGGGDFVIIRASGSTGYNDYIKGLGTINSVETLLIDSREKANSQEVREKIRNAEALFIAGGDQANYVKYWKDTEVSQAIGYLITTKKIPIGGTSAGCAVFSGFCFDANKGTAVSDVVLANPLDTTVSISKSFIVFPVLKNVLVDQHYSARKRQGRHVVFLARIMADFKGPIPLGIGIDESTAVAVEEDGTTNVFGKGSAFYIAPKKSPEQCAANKKLIWDRNGKALDVISIKASEAGTKGPNILKTITSETHWVVRDGVLVF